MSVITNEWRAILAALEAELAKAVARRDAAQEAVDELQRKLTTMRDALDITVEFGREKPPLDEPDRERLARLTIKEMIVAVASEKTPPVFKVVDINRRLVRAGMFEDVSKAASGVYPVLGRNPGTFQKLAPGKYRVLSDGARQPSLGMGTGKGQPGLRERVAEIREEHPEWTREDVTDHLVQTGWNFGSKRPIFAVNACFANAGRWLAV